MKLQVDGAEDTGFEKPRREMPAEVAVQQSCSCGLDCHYACQGGCHSDCDYQCGANPDLHNTTSSQIANSLRLDNNNHIYTGIL